MHHPCIQRHAAGVFALVSLSLLLVLDKTQIITRFRENGNNYKKRRQVEAQQCLGPGS